MLVKVSGQGYGRMNIDLRYNIPATKESTGDFTLTIEPPTDVEHVDAVLAAERYDLFTTLLMEHSCVSLIAKYNANKLGSYIGMYNLIGSHDLMNTYV